MRERLRRALPLGSLGKTCESAQRHVEFVAEHTEPLVRVRGWGVRMRCMPKPGETVRAKARGSRGRCEIGAFIATG